MAFTKDIERCRRLDQLIRLEATGSPKVLAERMKISERKVYEYLGQMKEMGAPILYNRHRNSYIYTRKGRFHVGFDEKPFAART